MVAKSARESCRWYVERSSSARSGSHTSNPIDRLEDRAGNTATLEADSFLSRHWVYSATVISCVSMYSKNRNSAAQWRMNLHSAAAAQGHVDQPLASYNPHHKIVRCTYNTLIARMRSVAKLSFHGSFNGSSL